jgi:hypothetical protein
MDKASLFLSRTIIRLFLYFPLWALFFNSFLTQPGMPWRICCCSGDSNSAFNELEDWVFASPKTGGQRPYWPGMLIRYLVLTFN